jgi:flagellar biosynthesis protein FlhA
MNPEYVLESLNRLIKNGLGIPLLMLTLLAMIVIPMPPLMLDIFFTFNISLALVVMLASIYIHRPLDFSVFPTVLLITTLLRLSLNIASTRVVLLEGHTGTDAAVFRKYPQDLRLMPCRVNKWLWMRTSMQASLHRKKPTSVEQKL